MPNFLLAPVLPLWIASDGRRSRPGRIGRRERSDERRCLPRRELEISPVPAGIAGRSSGRQARWRPACPGLYCSRSPSSPWGSSGSPAFSPAAPTWWAGGAPGSARGLAGHPPLTRWTPHATTRGA